MAGPAGSNTAGYISDLIRLFSSHITVTKLQYFLAVDVEERAERRSDPRSAGVTKGLQMALKSSMHCLRAGRPVLAAVALALPLGLIGLATPAAARDQIHIVGSSTVYPFSTAVAEQFAKPGEFKAPVVESTGTGGGMKLFCAGVGEDKPDIANASRKIKDSEAEACKANGVTQIVEVRIGYDGIVLANSKVHARYDLSVKTVWLALAKEVPVDGRLAPNPYKTWSQIDANLPAEAIEVLGPPPTSGTRDAFLELVMDKGCATFAEIKVIADDKARKAACEAIREDGAYVDAGENDNLIVQKLEGNPAAVGIFGYSFLEQNGDRLQASAMDGVAPSVESIVAGQYEVARSLYFYVKPQQIDVVPGIKQYVAEFMSDRASGPGGYLEEKGMIPLPADQHQAAAAAAFAALGIAADTGEASAAAAAPVAAPVVASAGAPVTDTAALPGGNILASPTAIFVAIFLLGVLGFYFGRQRALASVQGKVRDLHSLPGYHGTFVALCCALPALLLVGVGLLASPSFIEHLVIGGLPAERLAQLNPDELKVLVSNIREAAADANSFNASQDPILRAGAAHWAGLRQTALLSLGGAALILAALGLFYARSRIAPELRARNRVERAFMVLMVICSTLSILVTIGIVLSLIFESLRFFQQISIVDFLTGLKWSPQMALRADQVGSSGAFGAIPVFMGTMLITVIAMVVAVPIGLMVAVYLSDYATRRTRNIVKPLIEILAGIPTVVYGFFAALTVAPFIRDGGALFGIDVASESALAAGLVMGVMIIPFVSSLSDDVMNAVPQSLRDGAYALGATKAETIRQVVFPAALPGIVGGVLLAVSRAIGETMIVVMAAGLAANLTVNPFAAVTTVTVQIVTLLVGDQEFDSPKTLAAFALGLLLFTVTLVLNVIALRIVRRYREKYD